MNWTDYHSKLMAHELTRQCPSDSVEKLAGTLVNAQVDLNPHQVEAALFAFRSPLSMGAILADEVGLGKTIEAGLVISQNWAERKKRILIITPSNLRKQWHQELSEKFFLPCTILESKNYNIELKSGVKNPFIRNEIILCSYQFARNKSEVLSSINWDLVVIDEAHRLRNVYKPSNIIANTLKQALQRSRKLLLTATPLQNSLLELYGLVSFIDGHTFGDVKSFRDQFTNISSQATFDALKNRISPLCHRTLRRQVLPYIRYTKRHPIVRPFTPEENEDRLYNLMSDYLCRENLQALPAGQRTLMTLIIRKLLASSSFAIAGTFDSLIKRLEEKLIQSRSLDNLLDTIGEDYETVNEVVDEWPDEASEFILENDIDVIKREIEDLKEYKQLALSIEYNAKGKELIVALDVAFAKAEHLGAARKAIIFTESRRTQNYILRVLADSHYSEGIVLFNGSNNDPQSKQIYDAWIKRHMGTDKITGSKTADMRSALVDYFREEGRIMIATEAGSEGINLQFCSLVVNYDLPWNPQRIEQRIGRCHRYGQMHDVVVVNFINQANEADQRVFQLLDEKFQLFEGVFGASDEVLGAIESGIDFEKRIAEIYQKCRKPDEIKVAFELLQNELAVQIDDAMSNTRKQLMENFDDEVRDKLKIQNNVSKEYLNRYERLLMDITKYELEEHTEFKTDSSFVLKDHPFSNDIPSGLYELPRRSGEAHLYRLNHPLALIVLEKAKCRLLNPVVIEFNLTDYEGKISILDPYKNRTGIIRVDLLTVESQYQKEEYILYCGLDDESNPLDEDIVSRMFSLTGSVVSEITGDLNNELLIDLINGKEKDVLHEISIRNARFFEDEAEKLDGWADDLKSGLEREIKDIDKQMKEARKASVLALTLFDKLIYQKEMKNLELLRNTKRRSLFDAQDDIDKRRGDLIEDIEVKLKIKQLRETLFIIRWRIV